MPETAQIEVVKLFRQLSWHAVAPLLLGHTEFGAEAWTQMMCIYYLHVESLLVLHFGGSSRLISCTFQQSQ